MHAKVVETVGLITYIVLVQT